MSPLSYRLSALVLVQQKLQKNRFFTLGSSSLPALWVFQRDVHQQNSPKRRRRGPPTRGGSTGPSPRPTYCGAQFYVVVLTAPPDPPSRGSGGWRSKQPQNNPIMQHSGSERLSWAVMVRSGDGSSPGQNSMRTQTVHRHGRGLKQRRGCTVTTATEHSHTNITEILLILNHNKDLQMWH